jgi:hypothetical protein
MQTELKFKDKFIAYVDILGWKNFVEEAEAGTNNMSLQVLVDLLDKLGSTKDRHDFVVYGPTICPESPFVQRGLDFQLSQAYDCVVVSTEVSPAGVINLIGHCWKVVMGLLGKGVMCRGYITRGSIFHTDRYCIGTGHQKVLDREKMVSVFKRKADEDGTPFVEIDTSVCHYIQNGSDACVKEMFSRYVKNDGDLVALFPIQRMFHEFAITKDCNLEKERQSNDVMRSILRDMKDRVMSFADKSNARAVEKAAHYEHALDDQLRDCDFMDDAIMKLGSSFPKQRTK